jgi:uncharacterized membrane protein
MSRVKKERYRLIMGQIVLVGLLISFILTLYGGIAFLIKQGEATDYLEAFRKPPIAVNSEKIWKDAFNIFPHGLILSGILVLILSQLLRVALVAWYYFKLHDFKFFWLSSFILAVLIYSLFWNL